MPRVTAGVVTVESNGVAAGRGVRLHGVGAAQEALKLRDDACSEGVEGHEVAGGVDGRPAACFNEVPAQSVTKSRRGKRKAASHSRQERVSAASHSV